MRRRFFGAFPIFGVVVKIRREGRIGASLATRWKIEENGEILPASTGARLPGSVGEIGGKGRNFAGGDGADVKKRRFRQDGNGVAKSVKRRRD